MILCFNRVRLYLLVILLFNFYCSFRNIDLVTLTPVLESESVMGIWDRPSEVAIKEIDSISITGTAAENYFLGIPIAPFGQVITYMPNIKTLNADGGFSGYDALTLKAASQIQEKANSDAVYITRIEEISESYLLYYKRIINVTAKPIKLKFSPMTEAKADARRLSNIKAVKQIGKCKISLPNILYCF